MRDSRPRGSAVKIACCLLLAAPVWSQITHGEISGQIVDPSGRAIEGVTVRAFDAGKEVRREVATDRAGYFRLVSLAPATYRIEASKEAFAIATVRDIALTVDSRRVVNFSLKLSDVKEQVEVAGEISRLQADTSELSTVLTRERIASLPLNRRDFLQLSLLTPGVAPPVEESELSSRGSFAMHANGGREEFNNFLLDGADNNDANVNRYNLQPSVETIQEFKISTSAYSAEYGRSGAGQVNVITRSGSNEFHGSAQEYLRNRQFDARNFFASQKPQFVRNQYGLGAGGPVVRNRAFFFGNVEWQQERRGVSRLSTVPPSSVRDGNLAELGKPIFDPFTRQPFPNSILPSSRISAPGAAVLKLFPSPDSPGLTGNLSPQPVLRDNTALVHGRYDQQLTAKDSLTLRYGLGRTSLKEPYSEDTAALPGFGDFVEDQGQNAMVHYQRVFSPRVMNSLRVAFSRFARRILPENYAVDANRLLGVQWIHRNERAGGFPIFNVAGLSSFGDANSLPIDRVANTYHLAESFSVVSGRHFLRLGGDFRRNELNGVLEFFTRGSLSFSGALSGTGISDLLLGLPSFALQAKADNPQTLRSTASNVFAQDDVKLTPHLTLNLGVRYEYVSPATDPRDRMSTLNFTTGRLSQVGVNGVSRSGIAPDRNNLAPRVGLAWQLRNTTVIRAGYGLFFDSGMFVVNSAQYFNPPQFNLRVFFPTATSLITLNDPFRGGVEPPATLNVLDPSLVSASMQHWNFAVQQQAGGFGVFTMAYAGSKGSHLIRARNLNQPRPAAGDVQARRSIPAFGSIFLAESGANSNYHSLQATWDKPLSRMFSLWAVYTLAKSIDDASAFLGTKGDKNFPQDSLNYRAERGVSAFDIRQRLAAAYVVTMPGSSWWQRDLQLRGITTLQSAPPFTPILRFDNSNTGNTGGTFGSDRPNLLRNPALDHPTAGRWFDSGAFALPGRYQFGSAGRNILRGDGIANFDISLAKRFTLREQHVLSFEAQMFNAFNHTNLELPEVFADEPAFGRVLAAKAPRQFQFALRYMF